MLSSPGLVPDEYRAGIGHPHAADIAFGQLDGQRQDVRMHASHLYRRCSTLLRAPLELDCARFVSFDHDQAWMSACGDNVETA
jgi:hypothetical protein